MSQKRPVSETWSRTETVVSEGRHRWTVDDFKRRAASTPLGDKLFSPRFDVDAHTFHLEMYPNGEKGKDSSEHVGVFLHCKSPEDLVVKFDLCLERADGSSWGNLSIASHTFSKDEKSWGYYRAFSKAKVIDEAAQLLPDGKLTVVCSMSILGGDRQVDGKGKKSRCEKVEKAQKLGEKLAVFLDDKSFSDVTLVCGDRSFSCHKVLLAASSDVLSALFSHKDTAEARSKKVIVRDVDAEVMEQLLRFVYTDKCNISTKNASGLLVAANKYNIARLKGLCEEFVGRNVDLENFDQVLALSSLHDAAQLKRTAFEFVLENMERARESKGWKGLSETHPEIIVDLFMEQNKINKR